MTTSSSGTSRTSTARRPEGASALGGVAYHPIPNLPDGTLDPEEVEANIHPADQHYSPTRLIALENTHNSCNGRALTSDEIASVAVVAHEYDIPLHIDGARLFNAAVALETPPAELVKDADTVTFCLSKGLGCPAGSLLVGDHETIYKARKVRKMLGGAMRQAGIIAAPGIVALETMIDRLADDHANARKLARGHGDYTWVRGRSGRRPHEPRLCDNHGRVAGGNRR